MLSKEELKELFDILEEIYFLNPYVGGIKDRDSYGLISRRFEELCGRSRELAAELSEEQKSRIEK